MVELFANGNESLQNGHAQQLVEPKRFVHHGIVRGRRRVAGQALVTTITATLAAMDHHHLVMGAGRLPEKIKILVHLDGRARRSLLRSRFDQQLFLPILVLARLNHLLLAMVTNKFTYLLACLQLFLIAWWAFPVTRQQLMTLLVEVTMDTIHGSVGMMGHR